MKKIFIIVLLAFTQIYFAQSDNQIIQKDFEAMIAYTRQTKIDEIIEMTYPKLFEKYGKEGTKGLLSLMFGGMGVKTIYEQTPTNLKMSAITKIKDGTICLGQYNQNMVIEFTDEKMATFFLEAKMEGYEIEKIDSYKIRMKGKSYLLAIKDSYTKKTWKYLNYMPEEADSPTANTILSNEIITETKKLKNQFK